MLAVNGGKPLRTKPFPGWPVTGETDIARMTETVRSGVWHSGNNVMEFQKRFASDNGVKHCIVVANGTVSLEMIMRAMDIGYGDEVILPPYTFVATLSSILFTGASPVFADIDPGTYNISPADAESKITAKTKAIIAVAVAGCPPDLDLLAEVAKKHGIKLIIDAAQAVGAMWRGKSICTYGDAVSISCQNSKNLPSGEGGIITTNDDDIADKLRLMLSGGIRDGRIVCPAQDHNLSDFQASILLSQYEKLENEIYLREKNAAYLAGRLSSLPFLAPAAYDSRITRHAYHLFIIRLDSEKLVERGLGRDSFVSAVNAEGIPLSCGYTPLYNSPGLTSEIVRQMTGAEPDLTPLPNAETAGYKEGTWLYQSLLLGMREDIDDIADAMIKVWENGKEAQI